MFVGLLLALSSVGIDLTALSVLGGAIGVGVGFGLQKLAANYVSGFVMLAERSVRIGDNVRVDNFEGRITDINARYTVVRAPTGRESIVPNEMFITNRVENLSLADTQVLQSTVVSVGYDSDVELVMRLLTEAALAQAARAARPGPGRQPDQFWRRRAGVHARTTGLPTPKTASRTCARRSIWPSCRSLREHHIEIPYPQRVIHTRASRLTAMPVRHAGYNLTQQHGRTSLCAQSAIIVINRTTVLFDDYRIDIASQLTCTHQSAAA